jgi:hypothetical protein
MNKETTDFPVSQHPFPNVMPDIGKLKNYNFVNPNNFRLFIDDFENINFTIQNVTLPPINVGVAYLPTPMLNAPYPGDKMEIGQLEVQFLIDEHFVNYLALFYWIHSLVSVQEKHVKDVMPTMKTVRLFVNDSHNNPILSFIFHDAFPTNLATLQFDGNASDVEYLTASTTFYFSYYSVQRIGNTRSNMETLS